MSTQPTFLVTGASGRLGQQTVEFLLASGKARIIAGSRDTTKLSGLVAKGAEARTVDFDRPETLATAFEGVDRLLIVSTDALDQSGRRPVQHQAAINAAVAAGVKHILYTSATNASPDSLSIVLRDHHQTEQRVIASGLPYTILRNTLYFENLLVDMPRILATGQWFHAAEGGKLARASRADCARIAAAALESDSGDSRIIEVSGPELLDHDEMAVIISRVAGHAVSAIPVSGESLAEALSQAGLPEIFVQMLVTFDLAQAAGEFAVLTPAIQDLTGKTPDTFESFLSLQV